MNFFHSLQFGIFAMVTMGCSWCLVGLILGKAPKINVPPNFIMLFGNFLASLVSLTAVLFTGKPDCPGWVTFLTCLTYMIGGMMGFSLSMFMSYAMQRGPNGIIWVFIQSALIFPFLGGIIFHGMDSNRWQWSGLLLIIISLVFFACGKNNNCHNRQWLKPTLIAFLICGINGNIMMEPSYHEAARAVNSITRTLSCSIGAFVASLIYNLWHMTPQLWQNMKLTLRRGILWRFIFELQFFSLIFAYTLMYPGMNVMAEHGVGGLCYPLMIGSCIVAFSLCSIFILKEKLRLSQLVAIICCVVGLIGICL